MPQFIMKLRDEKFGQDYYLIWSTVVDAPVTYGMPLDEFKEWYQQEYGRKSMRELPERLERVQEAGISALPPYDRLETYFEYNRAGENETVLDKEALLENYCRNPKPTTDEQQ